MSKDFSIVREDSRIPRPVIDVAITEDRLVDFFEELHTNKRLKNKPLLSLFKGRASLSPRVRLAANLKNLLGCLSQDSVINVLASGLSDTETQALLDLEDAGVSEGTLAIAHGLLHISERQELVPTLSRSFSSQPFRGFIDFNP